MTAPHAFLLALSCLLPLPAALGQTTQEDKDRASKQDQAAKEAQSAKDQADAKAQAQQDTGRPAPVAPAQPANVKQQVQPAQPIGGQPNGRGNAQGRPGGGRGQPAAATPPVPAGPGASQSASQTGQVPFIQESGDFFILNLDETGDGIDLEWLTKMCQVATGKNFVYDEQVKQLLSSTRVRMFGEKRIAKSEFFSFYQILMFIYQFTLTKVGPDHLAVYLVQSLAQPNAQKQNLKNEAIYLTPEELDRYADQVATQVITVLHLPHTDVRTLGNSLRGITSDPTGGQGILPVGNTNSVILQGFASNVASIARILKLVDDESAKDIGVSPLFEVIPLEFAAAEDLSDILGELLEASKRQQQQQRQQQAQAGAGPTTNGGGETKILTYAPTNSLLVMALPEDMQAIKELVARLDIEVVEPERTYHVYVLEHAKAEDLSETLEDFIEGASRVGGGQSGGGGGARPGGQGNAPSTPGLSSRDNEVIVVPDESTNSLLIAASRRRYEEVVELIHRLDQRQDQVLIETALIELTGNDSLDIGVELGGADLPGSGTGSFGVTSFGLSTFADQDNDGIPDTRIPNASAGVTAGILNGNDFNLPVLLVALAGRQDTNVLNIPSVLVNNNGSATVEAKDEQPTGSLTQQIGQPSQSGFQGYQDAGITMKISPSISASGYLRLDIELEVSNFGSDPNPTDALPPPKTTRSLITSVSVPNGDTMVIGGIKIDNKRHSRQSIPWLGDVPLLGYLFRRDQDNSNQTTLYFFVTPHILKERNFADLAEMSYKTKLEAAEKIGTDRIQLIDPTFGKSGQATELQGFEVPMYRSPGAGEAQMEMIGQDPLKRVEMLDKEKPPPSTPPQPHPQEQQPPTQNGGGH